MPRTEVVGAPFTIEQALRAFPELQQTIGALIAREPIVRQREVLARRVADRLGIDFVALVNVVEDAVGAGEL